MSNSKENQKGRNLNVKIFSIISVVFTVIMISVSVFQLYQMNELELELNAINEQLDDLDEAWNDLLYFRSRYDLFDMQKVDYEVDQSYKYGLINETEANKTIDAEAFNYGIHVHQAWQSFFMKNPENSSQYLLRDEYKPFFYEVTETGTFGIHLYFLEPEAGDVPLSDVFPEISNFSYSYINSTSAVSFFYNYTIPILRNWVAGDRDHIRPVLCRVMYQGDLYDPLNAQVDILEPQLYTLRIGFTFNAIAVIIISFLVDFDKSGKKLGLILKIVFFILAAFLLYYSVIPPI